MTPPTTPVKCFFLFLKKKKDETKNKTKTKCETPKQFVAQLQVKKA